MDNFWISGNYYRHFKYNELQNRADIFRFLSLAFTSLTVCVFYADGAGRVINEDWAGLMDTMPTIEKALWLCVGVSIAINSISLIKSYKK